MTRADWLVSFNVATTGTHHEEIVRDVLGDRHEAMRLATQQAEVTLGLQRYTGHEALRCNAATRLEDTR